MNLEKDVVPKIRKKRSLAKTIREIVLLESGYMCANPNCRHILTLEIHHIDSIKEGGSDNPINLIALCPNCHEQHTRGIIPKSAIGVWKSRLISLNSTNPLSIDTLLHLYKMEKTPYGKYVRYSSDTLIRIASLINSGLLEYHLVTVGGGAEYGRFIVKLSLKGIEFVESWLSGKN